MGTEVIDIGLLNLKKPKVPNSKIYTLIPVNPLGIQIAKLVNNENPCFTIPHSKDLKTRGIVNTGYTTFGATNVR
jgi:hypothetical protein